MQLKWDEIQANAVKFAKQWNLNLTGYAVKENIN